MAVSLISAAFGGRAERSLIRLAEEKKPDLVKREPVVVFLPGTLASILTHSKTGEIVWGGRDRFSVNPKTPDGLRALSLPLGETPPERSALCDPVRASALLRQASTRIAGMLFRTPIYDDVLNAFAATGLRETEPALIPASGPSFTPLPFDWRRSISDGAVALGAALEARPKNSQKVSLVAHSMGASVALYYLMFGAAQFVDAAEPPQISWAGAKHVERAVLVGPAFRGSPVAIRNTVNGTRVGGLLTPHYPPTMLGTHPASFEFMPRGDACAIEDSQGRVVGAGALDSALWEKHGWGLLNPRHREGLGWLAPNCDNPLAVAKARQAALIRRAQRFHVAMDQSLDPPQGLQLISIAGTGARTPERVRITNSGVKVVRWCDGDGVVPSESAMAGFDDAARHPGKRLITFNADHPRMPAQPEVFEAVLDLLAE